MESDHLHVVIDEFPPPPLLTGKPSAAEGHNSYVWHLLPQRKTGLVVKQDWLSPLWTGASFNQF